MSKPAKEAGRGAASINAAIGSTGSGKSFWVKDCLRQGAPPRLLIWDPQDEYGAFGAVFTDRGKLMDATVKRPAFHAVYRPGDELSKYPALFDWFCRLAYHLGKVTVAVEELADVTAPQRAPDSWSVITRKGRHRGLVVFATSQRPASVDKNFLGNCTLIHCGRVKYEEDQRVMARNLGERDWAALGNLADLEFIELNVLSGAKRAGKMST